VAEGFEAPDQAALQDGVDPDRLSFSGALRVLRRAIPRAQRTAPKRLPLVYWAGR
jgi:hypothetical protein